jgi:hypothetical protein
MTPLTTGVHWRKAHVLAAIYISTIPGIPWKFDKLPLYAFLLYYYTTAIRFQFLHAAPRSGDFVAMRHDGWNMQKCRGYSG